MTDYQELLDAIDEKQPQTVGEMLDLVKQHADLFEHQLTRLGFYLMSGRARRHNLDRIITAIKEDSD